MKFQHNKELSLAARKALIKGLTKVAELYFNGEYDMYMYKTGCKVTIGCGICLALHNLKVKDAYGAMQELMFEMGNDYYGSYFEIEEPEQWEPRANMCLFLVEYLKDTIKEKA